MFTEALRAQAPDSALHSRMLPEATIRDARFVRTGYALWIADSLPVNSPLSLADRLLWENPLDIRANAPGNLATVSVRGAGPSRTPVFWNGINLQSSMNGVVDVALLPVWPGDQLGIHYGGQSAAQSSGAMGGSVVLEQGQQAYGEGFSGIVSGSMGSFEHREAAAETGFSGKNLATKIRASWQQAQNDFPYQKKGLDGQLYNVKQVNNFQEKKDFQLFNHWKINEHHSLHSAFWYQKAFREIPPATTESARESWQQDRAHRALIRWNYTQNARTGWSSRIAWLDDFLAFRIPGDTDTSCSRQILLSTERSASVGRQWSWRIGGTALRQYARVDGYADSTRWFAQSRLAAYTMGEWKKKNSRFSALIRQEWAEAQAAPFTASLGGQVGLYKAGEMKFHLSRNFNLPTLNDRFWDKLGKADLRPEKGYSADLSWDKDFKSWSFELTGYQLLLDDWILWQPDSTGLFHPDNLRKVWGRGIEGEGHWRLAKGSVQVDNNKEGRIWNLEISGRLQLSKTSNVAVYGGSESALGKQLPYTPRVSAGLSAKFSCGIFAAAYLQQFTGKRLDNAGKNLKPFSIGTILASCSFLKRRLHLDLRVENLWNAPYEIIRFRPMPGRSFQWSLGYRW